MAILEMKNISKSFSSSYANEKVSLSVEKGEIHALLGENGAGKTTLMNILFGIYSADEGEIYWKDKKVQFSLPKDAIDSGIGMVHQHFSLVKKMTVLDNVILGLKNTGLFLDRKVAEEKLIALAKKYELKIDPKAKISELSVGQQQRVEILKALFRDVELLILDEPTGVLTPKETTKFFQVLRNLKKEGHSIIIITHRMSEIMEISDKVTILRDGKKVAGLVTYETNPEELSNFMIGRELEGDVVISKKEGTGIVSLELKNISVKKGKKKAVLNNINLIVNKGEIVGVAGVEGNGQKELAEVISGIRKHKSGEILFQGENIDDYNVRKRFDKGISHISDDRHEDGLVVDMTVSDNFILRDYKKAPYSKNTFFNKKAIYAETAKAIEKYRIKTSGTDGMGAPVKLLSGGNQQKVIIAREITQSAKLIIANQPTRGLDIGATEFVRKTLVEQRNIEKSVLLISADLEEILMLSDRVAVMFGGEIMGILNREDATVEKIGLLMGGIAKGEE